MLAGRRAWKGCINVQINEVCANLESVKSFSHTNPSFPCSLPCSLPLQSHIATSRSTLWISLSCVRVTLRAASPGQQQPGTSLRRRRRGEGEEEEEELFVFSEYRGGAQGACVLGQGASLKAHESEGGLRG